MSVDDIQLVFMNTVIIISSYKNITQSAMSIARHRNTNGKCILIIHFITTFYFVLRILALTCKELHVDLPTNSSYHRLLCHSLMMKKRMPCLSVPDLVLSSHHESSQEESQQVSAYKRHKCHENCESKYKLHLN